MSYGTGPELCSCIPSQSFNLQQSAVNDLDVILPSRIPNLPHESSTASPRDTRWHYSCQRTAGLPSFPTSQSGPHQHEQFWQREWSQHADAASATYDTRRAPSRARERARSRGTYNTNSSIPLDLHKSQNYDTNQSRHLGQSSDPRTHRTSCTLRIHREHSFVGLDLRYQRSLSPHRFTASSQFLIDVPTPWHTAEQRNGKYPTSPSPFASPIIERCC
jgi:hypothetical protein